MRMIDFFDRGVRIAGDRPCLVTDTETLTYREVDAQVRAIANMLIADGFAPGAHAAVLSGNSAIAFEAVLGILRADGVWAMANHRAGLSENAYLFDLLDIDTVFVSQEVADRVAPLRAQCPRIRRFIALDGEIEGCDYALSDLAMDTGPVPQRREGRDDELAFLANTGGTTGRSKGVMLSNGNWQALVSSLVASMPMKTAPVNCVAAPMTHAAGPLALASMALGGTVVVLPRFEPGAVLEAIERHRVTYMFLPPTAIYMLLDHPGAGNFDLSSLEYVSYAGAPMALERLKQAIRVLGPVMNASFGQTESPMCVTAMPPHEHLNADGELAHPGSCGRPNLLSIVEIMDDEGNILGPGERGEIVVRGPLVMQGYYKNPEATEEVSRFGWHHTGDIGVRDEHGWFYVVDRKKDMIISGGFNVYPAEVEDALLAHPDIAQCAVIGVPHDKWGEEVIAFVEMHAGSELDEAAVCTFMRERVGPVKTPKRISVVAALPRTNAGKISRAELRKPFWEGREAAI
ncbi:class I adenylate-forming enzyme family protein [Novosphingobium mangrovi (ex Huang et al. 2023)]|uniref:AMP-binding protein n=1 Tax=Novosphingobium mangrovi (ex Huang et al. 2023) TaxID=2976432 RepID=A0ABT2I3E4_9SPHN|nr:AMP-binding protein [Novosphingobium mangrovi (ex Huang et al. 2023)]MCT2399318.1 AMP-binding protein [Novosphingobium mangrovi (ex Huang et al. 2023)]